MAACKDSRGSRRPEKTHVRTVIWVGANERERELPINFGTSVLSEEDRRKRIEGSCAAVRLGPWFGLVCVHGLYGSPIDRHCDKLSRPVLSSAAASQCRGGAVSGFRWRSPASGCVLASSTWCFYQPTRGAWSHVIRMDAFLGADACRISQCALDSEQYVVHCTWVRKGFKTPTRVAAIKVYRGYIPSTGSWCRPLDIRVVQANTQVASNMGWRKKKEARALASLGWRCQWLATWALEEPRSLRRKHWSFMRVGSGWIKRKACFIDVRGRCPREVRVLCCPPISRR
jgi:hypothetical protein